MQNGGNAAICPTCRSEIKDGAKFCIKCGARLEGAGGAGHASAADVHAPVPPLSAAPPPPQYAPPPGAPHGFDASQIPHGTPGAHSFALHPLGLGELFDRTLKLYLAHFWIIFAATAVIGVPLAFVASLFQNMVMAPEDFMKSGGAMMSFLTMSMLVTLLAILGASLQKGATAKIISDIYLNKDTSVGTAYRAALKKFWVLILAAILYGIAYGIGIMLCIAPGIFIGVGMSLYVFAIMFEDKGITESLTRSMDLIKGHWWKLALVLFLVTIINAIIGSIPGTLIGMIPALAGPDAVQIIRPLSTFISSLVQMAITPIATVVSILFYYDLRVRKEGYDLEIMAREIG